MTGQSDPWYPNHLYLNIPAFESMIPDTGQNIHLGHPGTDFLQHNSQPSDRLYTVRELTELTKYLPQDKFLKLEEKVYSFRFPMAIRLHLDYLIEKYFSPWTHFDMSLKSARDDAALNASDFLMKLVAEVESIPEGAIAHGIKEQLHAHAHFVLEKYKFRALDLYIDIRNCLELEYQLQKNQDIEELSLDTWIHQRLTILKTYVEKAAEALVACRLTKESFSSNYFGVREEMLQSESDLATYSSISPMHIKIQQKIKGLRETILAEFTRLRSTFQNLFNFLEACFHSIKEIQCYILDVELVRWRRNYQFFERDDGLEALKKLKEWCEDLASLVWGVRQQIGQLHLLSNRVADQAKIGLVIQPLMIEVTKLLEDLVKRTFIIKHQPSQVIRTNTHFGATVQLLVSRTLGVHMTTPEVTVTVANLSQVKQLLSLVDANLIKKEDYTDGIILNNQAPLGNSSEVTFSQLMLKKINRTDKKGTESVVDDKTWVLFWTDVSVGDLKFQIYAVSSPVVVTSHVNQDTQAMATITWDYAAADIDRKRLDVPDKVPWGQLAAALNRKWTKGCGRALSEDNLYYLACKAFRDNQLPRNDYNNIIITWTMFCKEQLPGRNFTFWEWFHKSYILIHTKMAALWRDGYIMGFVKRHEVESMLLEKPPGCFLLRFTDSEPGGMTIAYTKKNDFYQNLSVSMLAPFTIKGLSQRSIADVIFDLQDLTTLYPDTNKDVFREFCNTPKNSTNNRVSPGYVTHTLVTHVEENSSFFDPSIDPTASFANWSTGSLPNCANNGLTNPFVELNDPTAFIGCHGTEEIVMDESGTGLASVEEMLDHI